MKEFIFGPSESSSPRVNDAALATAADLEGIGNAKGLKGLRGGGVKSIPDGDPNSDPA